MPTLVVRGPDGEEQEIQVSAPVSIGRSEGNDVVLVGGGVSRKHAKVSAKGEEVLVEDAGSSNGTFIDGQRVEGRTPVGMGQVLQIGDYELRVKASSSPRAKPLAQIDARKLGNAPGPSTRTLAKGRERERDHDAGKPSPTALARRGGAAAASLGPHLVGITSLWSNRRFPIKPKTVVGRAEGSEIRLDDDSVSRRHAVLEPGPNGVRIKDLGSANGTAVNGEPLRGSAVIKPGDVLQFGVVELLFQDESRKRSGASRQRRSPGSRLLIVALAALMFVGAGGVAMVLTAKPPRDPIKPALPPEMLLQQSLLKCRTYFRPDRGDPEWDKAYDTCGKVLDIDPVNDEAVEIRRQSKLEQESRTHVQKADSLTRQLRDEEALGEYGSIPSTSFYYPRVKPKIKDVLEKATAKMKADCELYYRQREYKSAMPRCEAWLKFACQDMDRDQVVPPTGYKIRLELPKRGKLKAKEWMPKDPTVLKYYQARERVDPKAPSFKCERMEILSRGEPTQEDDPVKRAQAMIIKKYQQRDLAEAAVQYWRGKNEEAVHALQRKRQDMSLSELHPRMGQLMLDINTVAASHKAGSTQLQAGDVDKAAEFYREALLTDAKLIDPEVQKLKPSFFRDTIERDMSDATLKNGRTWMDRGDRKTACKNWKLGWEFFKGNIELNKALTNMCSLEAAAMLKRAKECGDLEPILSLAVDGDQVKQSVDQKKVEWRCP